MSRITVNKKSLPGVRVFPPGPAQSGAVHFTHDEDFPPPPPPPPPPPMEEDLDVRLVQPSQVRKSKIGVNRFPVKTLPHGPVKWKVPERTTAVQATQELLLSQGFRVPTPTPAIEEDEVSIIEDGATTVIQVEAPSPDVTEERTFSWRNQQTAPSNGKSTPIKAPRREVERTEKPAKQEFFRRSPSPKPMLENPELPGDVGALLIESCLSSSWTSVENLLRLLEKAIRFPEKRDQVTAAINTSDEEGETALHYAAREGKEEMVRLLVQLGADATVIGGTMQQLPLHLASIRKFGAWPIVQFLVPLSGPDGKVTPDKDGYIPLWRAAEAGNLHVLRELISEDAHQQLCYQNKVQNGDTLAHHLIRRKNMEIFRILMDTDGPTDIQNDDGEALLHVATMMGVADAVGILYEKRADPDILDNNGDTLVHIAARSGHANTVELLIKRGVAASMSNKAGHLALHVAAEHGYADVAAILIANGSSVDAVTKEGFMPLHLAVMFGHPNVVETLLGRGASVNSKGGKAGEAPLHICARSPLGDKSAELLIKSGANPSIQTEDGTTPLHCAVTEGSLKIVRILLQEGASNATANNSGETPLHIGVLNCHYDVVRELLDHISRNESPAAATAACNAQDHVGETGLHHVAQVAIDREHFEGEDVMLTQLLLDFNADANIPTKETEETPLHYCARFGNYEILSTILAYLGPERILSGLNRVAKNGWSPLLTACDQGNADVVRVLLKNNARVDVFDEEGRAALHLAAEKDHLEVVELLLEHKAFVNAKNKAGVTPAHLAAERGAGEIMELLVEKYSASTDVLSLSKKTPLHLAAQAGQYNICERLLRLGADPQVKDQRGQTPLHLAAAKNHAKIVQLLFQSMRDVDPSTIVDQKGLNVVHVAAKNGSLDVIQMLLSIDKPMVIESKVKTTDSTALHLAAAGGHDSIVELLVREGASATEENKEGMTPLHLAARYGHVSILECLKDNVSLTICSVKTGLTALHLAAFCGQVEFARELLTSVPVTIVSVTPTVNNNLVKHIGGEPGLTALHLACHSGQENMVRLLLNYPGAMADGAADLTGMTPLHMAAMNGHIPVVSLLLSKIGTKIDVKDTKGRSALMMAAANGHPEMVTLLNGQGADVSAEDNNGWTSLHHAAHAGHLKVAKVLSDHGASSTAKNKDGKIPMCLAAFSMRTALVLYLITKPHDVFELMEDRSFVFDLMMCSKTAQNKPLQEFIISSPSPVEIALKLARFYSDLSNREKERERDLKLAAKFCETLANDLLVISCNKFNPAVILRAVDRNEKSLMNILIEGEHKDVVALPAVQRYLTDVWHGNQPWSDRHSFFVFFGFLFCPPVWFLFGLPLGHKYNYIPFVKLMCHIVSHLYFIFILIIVFMSPFEKLYNRHDAYPTPEEVILVIWTVGKLAEEVTTKEERSGLGWLRVLILILSAIAFAFHFIAFAFNIGADTEMLYLRNQILGLVDFFACIQIISFLSFHYMFGPFAIIIRDVIKDLLRFLVILILFMVGFTFCLSALYEDVIKPPDGFEHENGSILDMALDPLESFKTLYFALFGLVDAGDLLPSKYGPAFAYTLITLLYAIYLMVTMVVLINLLIAMLSDTYQRIQARSDLEWKYGRAKLVMNMDTAAITPPPLNTVTIILTTARDGCKRCLTRKRKLADGVSDDNLSKVSSHHSVPRGEIWRKSMQGNIEVGASQLFRNIPVAKLPDCIDWRAVVAGYVVSANDEDELLEMEIENEIDHA
ncbi:Ankyrin-3 [Hypsibius exemplaris]|uniref:Ankyrin-3 n=1 Tax=Hypsibius exemplaris TaxID=2072580 RepID=A0A1W0WCA1_HYPEX|nr:Ankyrin-3 [Hypsibius exemplaris]